jgi:hypothetical protein
MPCIAGPLGTLQQLFQTIHAFQPGTIANVRFLLLLLLLLLFTVVAALAPRWCSQVYKCSNGDNLTFTEGI